jgi:hypothetical protein
VSTEVTGTLRIRRANPVLRRIAARTLDARRLAGWVQAGRAQGLEAGRLLALANAERASRLAASVQAAPEPDALTTATAATLPGLEPAVLPPVEMLALSVPGTAPLELTGDLDTLDDAGLSELLESDVLVLSTAAKEALEAEGFEIGELEHTLLGASVHGLRGEQEATVRVDEEGKLTLDLGVPGFADSQECEATRDALLRSLEEHGLAIDDDDVGQLEQQQQLARTVEDAVRTSLPGFRIRSIVEGDELQIVAVPPLNEKGEPC